METPVWMGRGFSPQEGTLALRDGRLRFELDERVVFDAPIPELRVTWPWYGFGCQMWAHANGEKYFLSFLHTNNTIGTWWTGVLRGRAWKRAIGAA
jgi:hypothetical protein